LVWGVALVALGVLLLLRNTLGSWQGLDDVLFAVLFAGAGAAFLATYVAQPTARWWAVIPACALLGIAALIALSALPGTLGDRIGAPVFLGALGLAFLMIYMREPKRWWAIIPAGAVISAGTTALTESLHLPVNGGAVMMFGLAATFGLLSLVRTTEGKMRWPLVPAAVLAGLGLMILAQSSRLGGLVWPILIVLVGVAFVVRSLPSRKEE